MYLDKKEIQKLNKINRLNLINSITGIKTINLIGTVDKNNVANLAIFSSIVHISSDPALIGFFVRKGRLNVATNINSTCKLDEIAIFLYTLISLYRVQK